MLPVCSATPCCSSHFQTSFHGGLRPLCPVWKDFLSRSIAEDRVVWGLSNGSHLERISLRTQAAKSLHSNFIESIEQSVSIASIDYPSYPNELDSIKFKFYNEWSSKNDLHPIGREKLGFVESYSISSVEEGLTNFTDQVTENAESLVGSVEPETVQSINVAPENASLGSDSLDMDNDILSDAKASFDDLFGGVGKSINASVHKGENAVKTILDSVTSFITSIIGGASESVDAALSRVSSTIDQTRELTVNRLSSFSKELGNATKEAAVISVDVLRGTVVAVEDSVAKGVSFVVYSYGSAKELLPLEIRDALNISEERTIQILRPLGTTFQQIYIAIEGLEKSVGLDPNDPVVPFILFLGTLATLWIFYWVWTYSGYSGDLSPQLTLELLTGKESSVLIDVRPEVLRERDGIPDLRRAARFRYANVTQPEVDGPARKLLKGGRDLDDALIAAVIRNLKTVQDRCKVIVMDANGNRSKGIARSLRNLGVKRPYLVQGGFQSWVKQGLRVKELKPETALTILNEEAEAILEDVSPSPVQAIGYGLGLVAALYAVIEWEKTLQLIGIVGLGQTIYRRVASYDGPEDIKQDVRRLLAPVRLGAQAFSWASKKLETNGIGLPTSPSSSDVQNRVLQAAAKHESQPSEAEEVQNPSPGPMAPISENADLSEA